MAATLATETMVMLARSGITLHTHAGPVIGRVAKPKIAAIAHQHHGLFAALTWNRSNPGVCPQAMVVPIGEPMRGFSDHRGGDGTTCSGNREQHGHARQVFFLLRGAEFFQYVLDAASYRKTLLIQKSKMRQQQKNVFAGRLNGARRE